MLLPATACPVFQTWLSVHLSFISRVRGAAIKGMDVAVFHRALPLLFLQTHAFDFNRMAVPRSSSWPDVSRVHKQGIPFLVIWNSDCLKLLSQPLSSNASNHHY